MPVQETTLYKTIADPPADLSFQPIGHVSIDWYDPLGDTTVANRELGTVRLSTFFILPSEQGKGYGNRVLALIEDMAARPPLSARAIALDTLTAEQAQDPAFWEEFGAVFVPDARINEHWYTRHGFTKYKEGLRYPADESNKDKSKLLMAAVSQSLLAFSSRVLTFLTVHAQGAGTKNIARRHKTRLLEAVLIRTSRNHLRIAH